MSKFLMPNGKATKRLSALVNSLRIHLRPLSSDGSVSIGDVCIHLRKPVSPELVPVKYVCGELPQYVLQNLRWIMQKDKLGQDVFLIGSPGPLRRLLAMQYLELTKREVEYIALSRDTTEADLKQRREISAGSAYYVDQCAVRAATNGRVLMIEGIEKAERNVLPVLNNLLENREMQLEDGRFLMAAERYDALLKEHSEEELKAWKLVRVSEDFRVIALGLPVPRYHGNPLDPPLRSRFQARDIHLLPFKDQLAFLQSTCPNIPQERLAQVASFAHALQSTELASVGLPDFPIHNLVNIVRIMDINPKLSLEELVHRIYPYDLVLGDEGQRVVQDALKTFNLNDRGNKLALRSVSKVNTFSTESLMPRALVEIGIKKWTTVFETPAGSERAHVKHSKTQKQQPFVMTKSHSKLLADMLESHSVHDFCLVGPKGCGKSVLVQQFADFLGYNIEPVVLYKDMTSRDLLQQRITLANGDTSWRYSPLILAALEGSIAELDGIHRVNPGTLAVLQRLISERELSLYDGTRLFHHERYKAIKEENDWTNEDMNSRGILCIHPSFRIIGLAEPPVVGSSQQQWLNSELLSMFLFHHVRPLTKQEEAQVIYDMVPGSPRHVMDKLLDLTDKLRLSKDPTVISIASSLSTRQLLRIARRLATYPVEDLTNSIHKACLARFLPRLAASSLEKVLNDSEIQVNKESSEQQQVNVNNFVCEIRDSMVHIGQTTVPVYNPENRTKVPDVLFYENQQHLNVMEDMLKDFMLGEHLLLVGNQGVGKNKVADRFLHLLNRPREYIQLHRDTTVQSLTLQPNVQDGVIIYEDSPLVRAVKFGHVLVVDEADKASTHVTCILKSLVENGIMMLGDGRRIVSGDETTPLSENVIRAHPDFRMIVLANRPGFPFLGNDFFGSLGDIFSCHAVDNPDFESEMSMLRQYGPSVPEELLLQLVNAFGELRSRADQGLISYPYSTREVVSVVKHLQAFPNEGLASVVRNVFDFDSYHPEVKDAVREVLHKHGIPVGASTRNINLSKEFPLASPVLVSTWQISGDEDGFSEGISCPVEERRLKIRGPASVSVTAREIERFNDRSYGFSEQVGHWDLPMHEGGVALDVAVGPGDSKGDWIHILAFNPISLYSQQSNEDSVLCIELFELFPSSLYAVPHLKMAALGGDLQGQVLIHEQVSNSLYLLNPLNKELRTLNFKSLVGNTKEKLTRHFSVEKGKYILSSEFANENRVVIYQEDSNKMDVVDLVNGLTQHITLPFIIGRFHPFARDLWLVCETGTDRKYLLNKPYPEAPVPCVLHPIESYSFVGEENEDWRSISTRGLPPDALSSACGEEKRSRSNRLLVGSGDYATIAVAQPDQLIEKSPVSFYSFKRKTRNHSKESEKRGDPSLKKFITEDTIPPLCLSATAQVVRLVPDSMVPEEDNQTTESEDEDPRQSRTQSLLGYLEVADVGRRSVRYIPFPGRHDLSLYARLAGKPLVMAPTTYEGIVTVDAAGRLRLWETGVANLVRSLEKWKGLIGDNYQGPLQVNYSRESGEDVTTPKHGKVDPYNAPHVGGNTWAGGTGGRDTAGLGGKGGPYRLDAGHDVHQLSDAEKGAVPDDVKKAAREMGRRAFKQRLREIQMTEYDAEMYESFSSRVRRQVLSLRVILDSLQARGKERVWLRNQTSGELDDSKLIEGLTGERAIYKKRGEEDPELGTPQRLPKRLRFVVDVSGSMYRFNSLDGRLGRVMEAACLVMEAFHQYDNKIKFDIVGHSGDSPEIPFVSHDAPPKNNKERLDIMKQMHAHAQYCWSGDHTLDATDLAIKRITEQEADDYFVVVLSDANLERYGIPAEAFGKVLTSDGRVNAFVIFIGSLGNQADRLVKKLPSGRAFVCMDTKYLPQVLQQIFTSAVLSSR
ncbi:von Willebrand factor A domain-containing protein 8-like isoform X1 [Acropora palmata]|uniref:von Willebrand factor A domain-containing protein 8-like isoform X1 n=1 Tax=Acropora palmata TaxID=6131 RepID=UPI003DA085B7